MTSHTGAFWTLNDVDSYYNAVDVKNSMESMELKIHFDEPELANKHGTPCVMYYDSIVTVRSSHLANSLEESGTPIFNYEIYLKKSLNSFKSTTASTPFILSSRRELAQFLSSMMFSTDMEKTRRKNREMCVSTITPGELFIPRHKSISETAVTLFMAEEHNILRIEYLSDTRTYYNKIYDNRYFKFSEGNKDINCMRLFSYLMFGDAENGLQFYEDQVDYFYGTSLNGTY